MKTPRVKDFDPDAKAPTLKSSMNNMPAIKKAVPTQQEQKQNTELTPPATKTSKQNASMPANQQTGNPEIQHASIPEIQQTSKLEIQHHITATEKVTYRFHPEGKYAIEDIKTILARKYGIKASYELIAEEAILSAYEDLLENQNASKLAKRLARTPENKKSS